MIGSRAPILGLEAESGARMAQHAAQSGRAANRVGPNKQSATAYQQITSATSSDILQVAAIKMAEVHGNRTHQPHVFHTARRF